jgi:hypothetical protein
VQARDSYIPWCHRGGAASTSSIPFGSQLSGLFRLPTNHFQMSLPAPWALQLEKKLADFDFVHEIGQSPITCGASHLRLENARHPVPLPTVRRLCETGRVTVGSGSPGLQSIEGWIYLYRSMETALHAALGSKAINA